MLRLSFVFASLRLCFASLRISFLCCESCRCFCSLSCCSSSLFILHCDAPSLRIMHQFETSGILYNQAQEYRATGTDDCTRNCTQTLHETVQNSANACEVHGRNKAPNRNINPAVVRGYASKCDALPKAGEAIRTPDIHVGNVTLYH